MFFFTAFDKTPGTRFGKGHKRQRLVEDDAAGSNYQVAGLSGLLDEDGASVVNVEIPYMIGFEKDKLVSILYESFFGNSIAMIS